MNAPLSESTPSLPGAADAVGSAAPRTRRAPARLLPVALSVVALAVAAWGWWDQRRDFDALREELAQRLRAADTEAREARATAKEASEGTRDAQARIGALDARMAESASQQAALESMYQEVARSRDDWVLAEVEQTLAIAAQQLQLAGNVPAALTALQTADARLARSDRPQFIPLRKVIARDIEHLKLAPNLDVPGMTLRLDQVIAAVDTLPLLVEGRLPASAEAGAPASEPGWWARAWGAVWAELKGLVRVQRLDAQDQSLLAPEQAYFLRESLKLQLLHARLALLQRNEAAFKSDLRAASAQLGRYFDVRQKPVTTAAATLAQLQAAAVNVELPSINESLAAVRNYKQPRGAGATR
jgi:uroporphyrin-3 C-methyltransferase